MFLWHKLRRASSQAAAPGVEFGGTTNNYGLLNLPGTSFTLNNVDFGTPSANRIIVVGCSMYYSSGGLFTVDSITIGGVSATKVVAVQENQNGGEAGLWAAVVPSGTVGNIDVVASVSGAFRWGCWTVQGKTSIVPAATATSRVANPSFSFSTQPDDIVIAFTGWRNPNDTGSWSGGMTKDFGLSQYIPNYYRDLTGASRVETTTQTLNSTCTTGAGTDHVALVAALWRS